ncbi:MAG: hypothetical protein P8J27_12790 [Mariniblastus sp.]|nr:hypothetical protein [Mariniblastus sp.]
MNRLPLLILLVGLLVGGGCAKLERPTEKSLLTFPKGRMAVDAVGLELGVAQLDVKQADHFDSFWNLLDQQEFPLELRKLLDQNGLRIAVMSSHPPPTLNELVGPPKIDPESLSEFEKALHAKGLLRPASRMVTHERISNREGQAHEIVTSDTQSETSWIIHQEDSKTVGTGKLVRGVMSITTFPQGDGSVRLVIQPQIHHGQVRPRIGVGQRSFLVESGQFVVPINALKFETTLRAGESLVIAPTRDVAELGSIMFGNNLASNDTLRENEVDEFKLVQSIKPSNSQPQPLHRILMVRVVQTQMDDLFSTSNVGEKLTTNSIQ